MENQLTTADETKTSKRKFSDMQEYCIYKKRERERGRDLVFFNIFLSVFHDSNIKNMRGPQSVGNGLSYSHAHEQKHLCNSRVEVQRYRK